VLLLARAIAAEDKQSEVSKQPLVMEVVPASITLDRAEPADFFVALTNTGQVRIGSLQLRLHVPTDVTQVDERWDGSGVRAAGSAAFALADLGALAQRSIKVTLAHHGAWTAVKAATVVIEATYTWEARPGSPPVSGNVLRPLALKIGALEGVNVFGVPLALAIFIVPGLLAISLFVAVIPAPVKWIDDNKLFLSFLNSMLLILSWNQFLRRYFGGADLWSGVSIETLFGFTVVAGTLGLLGGIAVRRCQRTGAERWPVRRGQPLTMVLANLAQRRVLPAASSTIRFEDGSVLSALMADSDTPGEVVLLPRRYRITVTDQAVKDQFEKALQLSNPGPEIAKLLRRYPETVNVRDGIKQQDDSGQLRPYPQGEEPIWRSKEKFVQTVEPGAIFSI
jgi:hypothetical protein